MNFTLHSRFTDGKRTFKVIGLEFHPQPDKSLKVFYEFQQEGTDRVEMREKEMMCKLMAEDKLRFI